MDNNQNITKSSAIPVQITLYITANSIDEDSKTSEVRFTSLGLLGLFFADSVSHQDRIHLWGKPFQESAHELNDHKCEEYHQDEFRNGQPLALRQTQRKYLQDHDRHLEMHGVNGKGTAIECAGLDALNKHIRDVPK